MARMGWWLIPVLIVALASGGAIGAFVADRNDERVVQITAPSGEQMGQPSQVIRVEEDRRWHGFGFFPFGFLLFPLFWIGLIWLVFRGFWRRSGPGWGRWDGRFEEWHRRQHEGDSQGRNESSPAGA